VVEPLEEGGGGGERVACEEEGGSFRVAEEAGEEIG
jgi:hypothetical protein